MGAGIRISGEVYSLDNIDDISMGNLLALKLYTKALGYPVGLKSINAMLTHLGELAKDPKFDGSDLVEDEEFLANACGLVYIVRRCAGDEILPKDAFATPPKQFQFADTDEDGSGDDSAPKDPPPAAEPTAS